MPASLKYKSVLHSVFDIHVVRNIYIIAPARKGGRREVVDGVKLSEQAANKNISPYKGFVRSLAGKSDKST